MRAPAKDLAFEDETFDVAVSTLVLCGVSDQPRALRQLRRVVRPGGQLLLIEHVRSEDAKLARRQDRMNPVNRLVVCCDCNRPTLTSIQQAGFAITKIERRTMPKVPSFVSPLIVGTATALLEVGTGDAPLGSRPVRPAISAGGNHSSGLSGNGTAKCRGANSVGELGNSTTTDSSAPVLVSGLVDAVAMSAGEQHACAALANGTAKCWGANGAGQLGNGTTTNSSTPVVVSALGNAVAISGGAFYSWALLASGTAKCWAATTLVSSGTAPPSTRARPWW